MKQGNFFFVIHKHQATSLHYDFRLQIGRVMPSWAIPKGPSLDPKLRRLAMKTTDHSLEYRTFEGVIAAGYGTGTVMIWDEGTYNPEREIEKGVREEITDKTVGEKMLKEELKKGEIKFILYGKKLTGSFALVKTRGFGGKQDTWLLIKHTDKYIQPNYNAHDYDVSARTGRSLQQITDDPHSAVL